jgi:hypothetical protein
MMESSIGDILRALPFHQHFRPLLEAVLKSPIHSLFEAALILGIIFIWFKKSYDPNKK